MNAAAAHVAFVMTLCSEDVLVITSCTARARINIVMAALPNIGGALCSLPQTLADAHY